MKPDESQSRQGEFPALVKDVVNYVRHLQEEGLRGIEFDQPLPPPAAPGPAPAAPGPAAVRPAPIAPPPAPAPSPKPAVPAGSVDDGLKAIAARVASCTTCSLHKTRTNTVPGQGCSTPEIMFIGEGPGADEDQQGLAFVGRAGQLLTKIVEAMGLTRDQVFIGNIVKCRPPGNRAPMPDEMTACMPFLREQIALLKPKVIVALGATAVKGLLQVETGITKLRGKWLLYEGIDLMPTFHPAYLLRNPAGKKDVWDDIKAVLAHLGRTPPKRGT